jgi:hypothetical protein
MAAEASAPVDEDGLSLHAARERYFQASGFDASSYEARWVRLQAGPLPLFLPNTRARVRAVKRHDLHHVLTGYATSWTGEAEIAAWELASGCGRYTAAWILNLFALAIGLVIAPGACWRAFLRGRHSGNFYREGPEPGEALLARRVGALRAELGLEDAPQAPRASDRLAFAVTALAAAAASVWLPALLVAWLA